MNAKTSLYPKDFCLQNRSLRRVDLRALLFEFAYRIRSNIEMTKLSPISDRFIRGIGSKLELLVKRNLRYVSDARNDLMSLKSKSCIEL